MHTTQRTQLEAERKAGALVRAMAVAARILNRDVLAVTLEDQGPAPAWTDFKRLFLNRAMLPSLAESRPPA